MSASDKLPSRKPIDVRTRLRDTCAACGAPAALKVRALPSDADPRPVVPDELRRLSDAADDGPWEIISKGPQANPCQVWHDGHNAFICSTGDFERNNRNGENNAAFIVAAVNYVRALLGLSQPALEPSP